MTWLKFIVTAQRAFCEIKMKQDLANNKKDLYVVVALVKKALLSVYFSFEVRDDRGSGSSGVHVIFVFVHGAVVATQVVLLCN